METTKKKILIVEDTSELRRVEAKLFEDANFLVEVAEDGQSGLEKIKKNQYDLVILDLVMPNQTGFDVLNELKTMNSTLPVIVYSNMTESMNRNEAIKLGATEYYEKLTTPLEVILEKVRNILE